MPRINASTLATLLGVRREKISLWHGRRLFVGEQSKADKRQYLFDLKDVRAAIVSHGLKVSPDAVQNIDMLLVA
jgi:hypothetical protein